MAGFAFISKLVALGEIQKMNATLQEEFNLPKFSLFQVLWQTQSSKSCCVSLKHCSSSFGLLCFYLSATSGNHCHISVALAQCITLTPEHCWIDLQGPRDLAGFWFRNIKSNPLSLVLSSATSAATGTPGKGRVG